MHRISIVLSLVLLASSGALAGEISGELSRAPWSGSFWPLKQCWSAFGAWSQGLAPFEKYDNYVFLSRGTNPGSAAREADPSNGHNEAPDPNGEAWTGHCHGWSAAALIEPEPPVEVTIRLDRPIAFFKLLTPNAKSAKPGMSKDIPKCYGKKEGAPQKALELQTADTKAMLTEIYTECQSEFWGERYTKKQPDRNDPAYLDIKPHQMHQLLVKYIKEKNEGLVFDIDPGYMVWNQPVYKFNSNWTENGNQIVVTTTVWWANDNGVDPNFHGLASQSRTYTYTMTKNAGGNIVNSEWTGRSIDDHPDFVWHPYGVLDQQNVARLELEIVREMIAKNGQTVPVNHGASTNFSGSTETVRAPAARTLESSPSSREERRRGLWDTLRETFGRVFGD
jgi:hypothetical protein